MSRVLSVYTIEHMHNHVFSGYILTRKPTVKGKIVSSSRLDDEIAERLTDMGITNIHATNDAFKQSKTFL